MLHICNKFCLRVNAVISIEILLKCLMSLPEGKIQQVSYYPRNGATWVSCPRADVVPFHGKSSNLRTALKTWKSAISESLVHAVCMQLSKVGTQREQG